MFQQERSDDDGAGADESGDRRGRVVVVTGASSGIGLATALEAAEAGDHVVLIARGVDSLESAADQCLARGARSALVLPADVADQESVRSAVDAVRRRFGRIDVVVHSAGQVAYGRFEHVPPGIFDTVIATNVLGSANVARAVLPSMRERGAGTLVLIGSLIGYIAPPYMSAYTVSKWAVRGLARVLQVENRDRPGVRICHVSPGGIDTPIYLQAANYLGWVGRPPPPVATPEQVARAALKLADRPRARIQVPALNRLTIAAFTLAPGIWDRIIAPAFTVGATDPRDRTEPTTGNVLRSQPSLNRLRGEQGNPLRSMLAAVRLRPTPPAATPGTGDPRADRSGPAAARGPARVDREEAG